MPRTKTTRNSFGSVFTRKIKRAGRTVTVYDARKRYRDADGKPAEKFKRCSTHAEAMIALANFNNEIAGGVARANQPHTFFELTDYFDKEYIKPAVFAHGRQIAGYRQSLKTIRKIIDDQKQFFGNIPLASLTYENIRLYAERIATTLTKHNRLPAVSTVNQKLGILRRLLNVGVQLAWIETNPFRRGRRLIFKSAETRRNRMLTFDEEVRLLGACTGRLEYLRIWIVCALDTAMRRGDIWALTWGDIDFANRVIYIGQGSGKTGVAGILPLTPRLGQELKTRKFASRASGDSDLVFGRIDYKKGFAKLCENAGIEDLQFRDLRAAAITRMLLAGLSGDIVRKISRHTKDRVFLDHYTRLDMVNAQRVGEILEESRKAILAAQKPKQRFSK